MDDIYCSNIMPGDVTEIRGQITRRLPWLIAVALLLFGLDSYQSEENLRTFLLAALVLLVIHGFLFTGAYLSAVNTADKKRDAARSISYAVVFFGAAWVAVRLLGGDWLRSSTVYLDAFMIGGLSGSLYFHRKKPSPVESAANNPERKPSP